MPGSDIGFTGTQTGMSTAQMHKVRELLTRYQNAGIWASSLVRHGMCIGADAEFDGIAKELGFFRVGYPGTDDAGNSPKMVNLDVNLKLSPAPYLKRNRNIVNASGILIATPRGRLEEQRSGTWATIRYAKLRLRSKSSRLKRIHLVYPDGVSDELKVIW